MVTRRDIIGGIAGILAARQMPAMPIGARSIAIDAKKGGTPTARDYVQSGLITQWDAIENAGYGVHDTNATTVKNLVASYDLTVASGVWTDTSYETSSTTTQCRWYSDQYPTGGSSLWNPISTSRAFTFEYVAWTKYVGNRNSEEYTGLGQFGTFNVFNDNNPLKVYNSNGVFSMPNGTIYGNGIRSFVMTYSDTAKSDWYLNSVLKYHSDTAAMSANIYPNRAFCNIHAFVFNSVRFYDRILTAAEIAANYAVDKARFNLS